jgi:VWFA-related protein
MTLKLLPALLFIFVLLPSSYAAQRQAPAPFKARAEEVVMHVLFTDRFGRSVDNIRPDEVRIYEDGEEQKLSRLFASEEPFDVGLLLDTSPSTHDVLDSIVAQSAAFLRQVTESSRILLLSFDDEVYIECDWTDDSSKVDDAIRAVHGNKKANHTVLYDAVTLAAEKKFSRNSLRKAMIVYTDGIDEGSSTSEQQCVKIVEESGILTYTIQFDSRDHYRRLYNPNRRSPTDPYPDPPVGSTGTKVGGIFVGRGGSDRDRAEYMAQMRYDHAKKFLTRLAQAGAGRYYETLRVGNLGDAYSKIVQELSKTYTVTYVPARRERDGKFHRVKITTTRDGVAVQTAREGYFAK